MKTILSNLTRLVLAIVSVAVLATHPTTLCAGEPANIAAFIDSIGQRAVEAEEVVGLSIGVAQGEEILYANGFGLANVELNVPATADTVYRIGSITKEFTAAAILLLVDDGKISLDDPLTKYLPEYPPQGHEITIRHLLQHTSGVKDFTRLPAYRKQARIDASQQQVLDRFQHLPLNFQPGSKHRYSNSGFFLLGIVIEKASGKSYNGFVEERLFGALGLKRTYCDDPTRIIPDRATGYTCWEGVLRNAPYVSLKQSVGAGNLASTVGDLLVWQQALVANRLLSRELSQTMMPRGKLDDGTTFNYGLGLVLRKVGDHQVVRHGGGILGFRGDLAYYPASGHTIAVLANCQHANAAKISDRIARHLLAATTEGE